MDLYVYSTTYCRIFLVLAGFIRDGKLKANSDGLIEVDVTGDRSEFRFLVADNAILLNQSTQFNYKEYSKKSENNVTLTENSPFIPL